VSAFAIVSIEVLWRADDQENNLTATWLNYIRGINGRKRGAVPSQAHCAKNRISLAQSTLSLLSSAPLKNIPLGLSGKSSL
jgi:hypothetical protein